MPMDCYHAFATGVTYPVPSHRQSVASGLLNRILSRLAIRIMERQKVAQVISSFQNHAIIGKGVMVGPNAWCANIHARENIQIGNNTVCRGILRIENFKAGRLIIADQVYIGDDCVISCAENIEIGELTLIAHGVHVFDNDSHPIQADLRESDWHKILGRLTGPRTDIASSSIRIGKRVWIGFNSIIMKGISIGDNTVVTAGSVVIEDCPANVLVAGNPARTIKTLNCKQ